MRPASEPATAADFRESFGEELRHVLDVTGWRLGGDLAQEYPRIEREVRDLVQSGYPNHETLAQVKRTGKYIAPR